MRTSPVLSVEILVGLGHALDPCGTGEHDQEIDVDRFVCRILEEDFPLPLGLGQLPHVFQADRAVLVVVNEQRVDERDDAGILVLGGNGRFQRVGEITE